MDPENLPAGAPAADTSAPAAPQTTLNEAEQAQLASLPDFLVNNLDPAGVETALFGPPPAPAPAPEAPKPDAAAPVSAPAAAAPATPEAAPTAPDPLAAFFENQAKVNAQTAAALEALTARLAPPPPKEEAPPQKRFEDMSEEEQFLFLIEQRAVQLMDAKLKPLMDERAAAQAAKAAADAQAAFQQRAAGFIQGAEAALPQLIPAEKLATLTDADKAAAVDEILACQAANAELKDAQGNIVGMTAAQAAAVVKARWQRMAGVFAPAPAPRVAPQVPRALAGQPGQTGPGVMNPMPYVNSQGQEMQLPDMAAVRKAYGGSTDRILDGLKDGFRRVQKS
jgi:hypothetical protein